MNRIQSEIKNFQQYRYQSSKQKNDKIFQILNKKSLQNNSLF